MQNKYNIQGILSAADNRVMLTGGGTLNTATLLAEAEAKFKESTLPSDNLLKTVEIGPDGNVGYFVDGLLSYKKNKDDDSYQMGLHPRVHDVFDAMGSAMLLPPTVSTNILKVAEELFLPDVPGEKIRESLNQKTKERERILKQNIKEEILNFDPEESSTAFVAKEGAWEGFLQNVSLLSGMELAEDPDERMYQIQRVATELDLPLDKTKAYLKRLNDTDFWRKATAALTNSALIMAELAATRGKLGGKQLTKQGVKFLTKEGLKHYGSEIVRQGLHSWKLMAVGSNIRADREATKELQERAKNGEDLDLWDWIGTRVKHMVTENTEAAMEGASEGLIKDLRLGSVGIKRLLAGSGEAWGEFAKNLGKHSLSSVFFETATEQVTDITSDLLRGTSSSIFNIDFIKLAQGEALDRESQLALENLLIEMVVGGVLGSTMGIHRTLTRKTEEEMRKHFPKTYEALVKNDKELLKEAEKEVKEKTI